jgi:tripartite-type tricarboxylate transporter receptor subunit TctC
MRRRQFFTLAAGALSALGTRPRAAGAQSFPSRPITIIVPFAAGGPTDTLARILGDQMRAALGQPVIVENVTGAGSTIGVARAARAEPDGHTICVGTWTSHVGSAATYQVAYDIQKDFAPVALLPIAPTMIIGRSTLPARSVEELVAWLKANPGKASSGTIGAGSPSHVLGVLFKQKTNTQFEFVPYRGATPAMQDLIAGQIDLRFGSEASQTLPYLHSKAIKAFAILGRTRWSAAPDIPTIDEAGVPGLHLPFWNGMWAPAGTPRDVVAKLNGAVRQALADPTVRQRLSKIGLEIPAPEDQSPEALAAFQKAEIDKWWPVIKAAGIKAQ